MPQTPFLIAGTLRENICYGLDREVSDEEMEEVVRRACLAEFVNGLPERFDFLVSEAGGGPVGRAEAEDCHCQGVFKGCKGFDFGRGHLGA